MRIDVHKKLTDQFVSKIETALETGQDPDWRRPWNVLPPTSLQTGKPYRGMNALLLSWTPYTSPYWVTFNQAKKRGGYVRRGEKGTHVVLWKWIKKTREENGETFDDSFPILKLFSVWNVEQTENVANVPELPTSNVDPIESAEAIFRGYVDCPPIAYGGGRAYYHPGEDRIQLPARETFKTPHGFYATAFHEMIHSTGHASRLDRFADKRTEHSYAFEELVAELGSTFLLNRAGIDPSTVMDNASAYLQGWLRALKSDTRFIMRAATHADKATRFIAPTEDEDEDGDA